MKDVAFDPHLAQIHGLCKQKTKERCSRLWKNCGCRLGGRVHDTFWGRQGCWCHGNKEMEGTWIKGGWKGSWTPHLSSSNLAVWFLFPGERTGNDTGVLSVPHILFPLNMRKKFNDEQSPIVINSNLAERAPPILSMQVIYYTQRNLCSHHKSAATSGVWCSCYLTVT